jgi:L-alanine-DL-glutamate epimerase-like enolase superfamily enzyme
MNFTLKDTRLGLRDSHTRIPFRYGNTCLTHCPQAVFEATIETNSGTSCGTTRGYAGDCLPPGWFDKTPGRSFDDEIADMLASIETAVRLFGEAARQPVDLFTAWHDAYQALHASDTAQSNPLLANFGLSFVERAVMDALARAAHVSFAQAVRNDLYAIRPEAVHKQLAGLRPRDWLPAEPLRSVFVRHTIGLGDPLTAADVSDDERLADGFPQTLEDYLRDSGLRYFKVKLSGDSDIDRSRLLAFLELVSRYRGDGFRLTVDGNEQFKTSADFARLEQLLVDTPELEPIRRNMLAIEQPLGRAVAFDNDLSDDVQRLCAIAPVIIDESDGTLMSYAEAIDFGYRGVSSKNCKGPIKSLLNAGLTWLANMRGEQSEFIMTGEDLCSVGVIPVQADLCLAATLGLDHVERNGHHYHRGLGYLPEDNQQAALAAHGDFYAKHDGVVSPRLREGRFEIASLQCEGFGFAALPDMDATVSAAAWQAGRRP